MSDDRSSIPMDEQSIRMFPDMARADAERVGPREKTQQERAEADMASKMYPEMAKLLRKKEDEHNEVASRHARTLEREVGLRKDGDEDDEETGDKGSQNKGDFSPDLSDEAKELFGSFDIPEGYELDPDTANEFASVASQLGLDSQGAARLVKLDAERQEAQAKAMTEAYNEQIDKWNDQLKQEYGERELQAVSNFFDQHADEEFSALVASSGLGSHPAFIRFISSIAKGGRR